MDLRQFRREEPQDAARCVTASPGGRQVRHAHPAARATANAVVTVPAVSVRSSACRERGARAKRQRLGGRRRRGPATRAGRSA